MFVAGGKCEEDQDCDNILEELENIDDELDEAGIIFVTTEDTGIAKKNNIKKFPALAFFRNKEPVVFQGNLLYLHIQALTKSI